MLIFKFILVFPFAHTFLLSCDRYNLDVQFLILAISFHKVHYVHFLSHDPNLRKYL
jgi:hypothetical protein